MLTRFVTITKGVLDFRDMFYFVSMIAMFLYINMCIVEYERAS